MPKPSEKPDLTATLSDIGAINAELQRQTRTIREPGLVCRCGRPVLDHSCQICTDLAGAGHGTPELKRVREKEVCATCAARMLGEHQNETTIQNVCLGSLVVESV